MTFDIPDAAVEWLRSGEHGSSSLTIFERMTDLPVCPQSFRGSAPRDPSDLRRCLLLLRAVAEFEVRLPEMATVGDDWAALIAIWPELAATFDEEIAEATGKAPRTWDLMQKATGR